jgi:hypothetical protein
MESDNGNQHAESEREAHHKRFIASMQCHFADGAVDVLNSTGGYDRGMALSQISTLHPLWMSFLSAVSVCVFNGYDVRAVYFRMQEVGLISNSLRVTDSLLGNTQTEGPRAGREGTWVGAADSILSEVSRCVSEQWKPSLQPMLTRKMELCVTSEAMCCVSFSVGRVNCWSALSPVTACHNSYDFEVD